MKSFSIHANQTRISLLIIKSRNISNGKIGHFLAYLFADSIPFPYDIPCLKKERKFTRPNSRKANIVKRFADDTKLYAVVNEEKQQIRLQNVIDSFLKWSDRWLLKFNKSKCKHIHLGPNTNIKYKMRESNIQQVTEEKDLGIRQA